MNKKQRIWLVAFFTLALLALMIFIWQFPNFGEDMRQADRSTAQVQTNVLQNPQQPQVSAGPEPSGTEETTEPMEPDVSEDASILQTEPDVPATQAGQTDGTSTEPSVSDAPVTEPDEEPTTAPAEDLQARIDELIDTVYALKDEYTARLYAIEAAAIAEYKALPENEKTEENKRQIALRCVDEAYALEKECDGRIDDICYELGVLLIKNGGKMALVNEIRYVYASEKTAAKNELTERYAALLG